MKFDNNPVCSRDLWGNFNGIIYEEHNFKLKICVIIFQVLRYGQIKNYYLYIDRYNYIMQCCFINTNYNFMILLLLISVSEFRLCHFPTGIYTF